VEVTEDIVVGPLAVSRFSVACTVTFMGKLLPRPLRRPERRAAWRSLLEGNATAVAARSTAERRVRATMARYRKWGMLGSTLNLRSKSTAPSSLYTAGSQHGCAPCMARGVLLARGSQGCQQQLFVFGLK
jgi:hypothetical protein